MENTINPQAPLDQPTQVIPEILTPNQALHVLVQAAVYAQKQGIFTLEDAEAISKAIKTFSRKDAEQKAEAPVPATTPEIPVQ